MDKKTAITIQTAKGSVLTLEMSPVYDGERRLIESRHVNATSFNELSYSYNEGYRQAKALLSSVYYQIQMAKKRYENAKANVILNVIPKMLEEKKMPKSANNSAFRDACFTQDDEVQKSIDILSQLEAVQILLEGKCKVFTNACTYMRKVMDLGIRMNMGGHGTNNGSL